MKKIFLISLMLTLFTALSATQMWVVGEVFSQTW